MACFRSHHNLAAEVVDLVAEEVVVVEFVPRRQVRATKLDRSSADRD